MQEIQLELLRRTSFNALDGERVADSLVRHRDLWLSPFLRLPESKRKSTGRWERVVTNMG